MKRQIKKLICITLCALFLFNSATIFASAKKNEGDIFYGYVEALGIDSDKLGWFLAARDKDDVVYIEANEFARLANGKIFFDDSGTKFKYLIGNWNIKVDTDAKKVSATLSFEYAIEEDNALFSKEYYLTEIIEAKNGDFYLPLEEMMYICCMEWQCYNGTIYPFRPYTLFDIICDSRDMLNSTVDTNDLLGDGLDYYGNSFKYGISAALDEINFTFIYDSAVTSFYDKAAMSYEIENLCSALLTLISDVPADSDDVPAIDDAIFKLAGNVATVMDVQTADDAARLPLANKIIYNFAKVEPFDDATAAQLSKVSGATGLLATTLSYLVSVTKTLEATGDMPENFKERLDFIEDLAKSRKDLDNFYIDLEKAAKETYKQHYTTVSEAFAKNVNLDTVTGLVTGVANFSGGIEKVAWPLCYASVAVGAYNLVIDGLKLIPAISKAFENGENAFDCLNLLHISSVTKTAYKNNAATLADHDNVTEKWLSDVRLAAQCMLCASLHAHEKLVVLGKASVPSGGYKEALYLSLLSTSEYYDDLLFLSPTFKNIHDDSLECTRMEIPPEYVFYKLPLLTDTASSYPNGKLNIEVKPQVECPHPMNVPEITIDSYNDMYGGTSTFKIVHEFCKEPYVIEKDCVVFGDFTGFDMGDGEYTYVLNLYCVGTRGGAYSYVYKVIDGVFTKILTLDGERRDVEIWVEGSFVSSGTIKGVLHPSETPFEAVISYPNEQRTGTEIWENGTGYIGYEKNADGFYDIIFKTNERNLFNGDGIGGSHSRFILNEDGELVLKEQWYKAN